MPYLPEALTSLSNQNHNNFEIIVQDSQSTDETLITLDKFSHLPLNIVSEKDNGIGDGYDKALSRCNGDIIGSIDADNILMPNALKIVAEQFEKDPSLAVLYSPVQMLTSSGEYAHMFYPSAFILEDLLSAKLVPPFSTSFFSKIHCGRNLIFDKSLNTCADFNLWLMLSNLNISCIDEVLGGTRMSEKSMTCDPNSYEQFCNDKIFALDRFLNAKAELTKQPNQRNKYVAGIYIWAAESLFYMEGLSERTNHFYHLAKKLDNSDDGRSAYFEEQFIKTIN